MATSDADRRQSPLAHRNAITGDGDLAMHEVAFLGKFIMRADPKLAQKALKSAIPDATLPQAACSSTSAADSQISVLWLGPEEWMIVCAPDADKALMAALHGALDGQHYQISDVGDYYTCIDLTGEGSRDILMNLSTLDLHPDEFKIGDVKGSVFGHANAWLWQLTNIPGQSEVFRMIIRASMADYLWCLMAKSGKSLGMPKEKPIMGEKLVI